MNAVCHAPAAALLRPAGDADSATVRRWRNHPAVRRVMFTTHEIEEAEHAAWWQHMRTSDRHQVLLLRYEGRDCGVVTFTRDAGAAHGDGLWHWGFYLDPDSFAHPLQQLRAWAATEQASLDWAVQRLTARRLACEVFADNRAVLQLHLRHGFAETGRYQRPRPGGSGEVVQLSCPIRPAAAS